jgi:Cd2+/Zn2+-exporting ATPase
MTTHTFISPARRALNPILSDDPMIDLDGGSVNVFYTPTAQWIARRMELIVAAAAGVCLLIAFTISRAEGPRPLQSLFTLLAFAIAGVPALETVWSKVRKLRIDVDLLMLLGAALAAYIGSPFEGALLLFLFALAGGLEAYALRRTQSAIVALRDLAPKEATRIDGDTTARVPLRQIAIGARILVRPGEKVPLDGTIAAGSSSLDESAITGESIPRECAVGDAVLAGTQNLNGRLEVRVTKLAADSTLARIVHLVTEARHHPARTQRLIDRVGPTYSVVVIVAAIVVGCASAFVFGVASHESVRRGIAVLIVASPCALIIATPVAYLAAIAAAARRGVLVKGGAHLEVVAQAAAVAFDKTGTLTTGRIRLTDVDVRDGIGEGEALRLAGAIEGSSTHPLAEAVNRAVKERSLTPAGVTDYRSTPGEGASATIDGRSVWIGRPELLAERAPGAGDDNAGRAERFRREGKTASAMVIDGKVTFLGFEDTVRDQAAECIRRLRRQGIRWIEMLTGDHEIVAGKVAERLHLDGFLAALKPEDKLTAVEKLRAKYGTVVLVGDGINDAPALAHADVGIAMGARGAEVAMEAADIVLMKDRIEDIAWLHRHARRTAGIVRQNLTLAIGVITVLSVVAALGSIPLPLAVVGHEGSTIVVALNALRLLRTHDV